MRWRVFPATWDGQQREGDVAQIVDEGVNGVRVVKAFGQEGRELDRLVESARRLYGSQMRAVRIQARYQPLLQAIPAFGQVAILAVGGYLALQHEITIGTFLAFSTYVAQMVAPARMLAGVLTVAQQARAGVERIFQLIDLPPAIADRPDAVDVGRLAGAVDFDRVSFAYPDGPPVLEGFDLHIAPGERVALVGPSGSGKSTVALMVGRFYDPDEGCVRVDGHDVRGLTLHSLRRQLAYVFEETFLFSESVRANIAYGRPQAGADEIESAARVAGAHDFIEALPRGYDTVVGERGLTLSGGQRQRIALARAISGRPADPDPRRRHQRGGCPGGGVDSRRPPARPGRADHPVGGPPPIDASPGRPDRGARRRASGREVAPMTTCSRRARSTGCCCRAWRKRTPRPSVIRSRRWRSWM